MHRSGGSKGGHVRGARWYMRNTSIVIEKGRLFLADDVGRLLQILQGLPELPEI